MNYCVDSIYENNNNEIGDSALLMCFFCVVIFYDSCIQYTFDRVVHDEC